MKRLSWFGLFSFLQLKPNTELGITEISTLQETLEQLAGRIKALEDV